MSYASAPTLAALTKQGSVGVIVLNNPPVNALSHELRLALRDAFTAALQDPEVLAILLWCEGRTFVAGADIREFGKPALVPDVPEVVELVANASKPVTAALHGTALGGGAELALACAFRVAAPSAKLGFPEVGLGILPGAGGTQRLPRLIGVRAALDMIVGGAPISAAEGLEKGLIDQIIEGDLKQGALAFVERIIAERTTWTRVSDRAIVLDDTDLFEQYETSVAAKHRGRLAPGHCVKAIRASVELPFSEGLKRERELFRELMDSPQSKAQCHVFFAERDIARSPRLPDGTSARAVRTAAIIGTDEETASIAEGLANSGLVVTRLGATPDYGKVHEADLVLTLVTRELLPEVLTKLDAACKPETIFAVGAERMNIREVAGSTKRPDRVLGIHFTGQRLMEIVSAAETDPTACASVMKIARSLGRMPVLEFGDHAGARLSEAYLREACLLFEAGALPAEVDRVLSDFGFDLAPLGAFGRAPLIQHSERHGVARPQLEDGEILERCLYAIVNEGAHLLHEGVLSRALEVDILVIHGQGFPVYRGGPMYHADQLGLGLVYEGILRYAEQTGNDHWKPSALLAKLAEEGRGFYA
jgi:3-hydroxyacyl-CoA dehydrogenase